MGIEPTQSAWKAEVLPLNYTRDTPNALSLIQNAWWRGKDSNLRRLSRQIYSLLPLTAREPLHERGGYFAKDSLGCQPLFLAYTYCTIPLVAEDANFLNSERAL